MLSCPELVKSQGCHTEHREGIKRKVGAQYLTWAVTWACCCDADRQPQEFALLVLKF